MTVTQKYPLQGGCDCGAIRYQLECAPLVIHCCHCTWCQRETGTAFAINIVIESDNVTTLPSSSSTISPIVVNTPSASGNGQDIARCPTCHVAVWSHYNSAGPLLSFVRAGTLDEGPAAAGEPDMFIFTSTKVPWVTIPEGKRVFEEFYGGPKDWSEESQERFAKLEPRIKEWNEKKAAKVGV